MTLARALELFSGQPNPGAVPMVFVITDGAVEDEREICAFIERAFKKAGADPAAMLPRREHVSGPGGTPTTTS